MNNQEIRVVLAPLEHDELQAVRESACEGCKGDLWFWDSDCRFYCDAFAEAAQPQGAKP